MIKQYIRGNDNKGTEVIKLLESLGGVNTYNHNGSNNYCLYYINQDKCIDYILSNSDLGQFITTYCDELFIPGPRRWRASVGECYYYIDYNTDINRETENNGNFDTNLYNKGNYFKTKKQAQEVLDLLKEKLIKDEQYRNSK